MEPTPAQRAVLEEEHGRLQTAARERRSVDLYARAGFELFLWGILGGVIGKLFWDSIRPPLFLYPLVLLDLALLWDAVAHYRKARAALALEGKILARLREVRVHLGIDPPPGDTEPLPLSGARTLVQESPRHP
jgi:hypothetical protein